MSITKFAKCERNFVCGNFYLFPNDFLTFCYYTPAVALHTSNFLSHKKIPRPWDISKKLSFENTHNAGGICSIFYYLSCFYRCPNKLCKIEIPVEALFIRKDCRIVYSCRNRHLISDSLILKGNLCYHVASLC